MLKVKYAGEYQEKLKGLVERQPGLKDEIGKKMRWFRKNPMDARLGDHGLKRNLRGKRAFSITSDVRVVYRQTGKNSVDFLDIGGHEKVYGES